MNLKIGIGMWVFFCIDFLKNYIVFINIINEFFFILCVLVCYNGVLLFFE